MVSSYLLIFCCKFPALWLFLISFVGTLDKPIVGKLLIPGSLSNECGASFLSSPGTENGRYDLSINGASLITGVVIGVVTGAAIGDIAGIELGIRGVSVGTKLVGFSDDVFANG